MSIMGDTLVEPVVYKLEITVGFHPAGVCCEGCRFCRTDTTNRDRKRCAVTDEVLWNTMQMGMWCPLKPVEKEC